MITRDTVLFFRKGDEIQKLSVIQNLPSLLATDTQSCMSRVVPKMQQSLATASTEFHIAASSTFKTILEQKLVSHNVFSQTFLQSILNSLGSRDPGKYFYLQNDDYFRIQCYIATIRYVSGACVNF